MRKGAAICLTDDRGWTALHYAIHSSNAFDNNNHARAVKLLLQAGADFTQPNNDRITPEDMAANLGNDRISKKIKTLISKRKKHIKKRAYALAYAAMAQFTKKALQKFFEHRLTDCPSAIQLPHEIQIAIVNNLLPQKCHLQ